MLVIFSGFLHHGTMMKTRTQIVVSEVTYILLLFSYLDICGPRQMYSVKQAYSMGSNRKMEKYEIMESLLIIIRFCHGHWEPRRNGRRIWRRPCGR